ncbi:MAG: hypothetical protein ACYCY3_11485 [Halothiobacillus sp.]
MSMNQARWLMATFIILAVLSFVWGHNPAQLQLDHPVSGSLRSIQVPKDCQIKGFGCSLAIGELGNVFIRAPTSIKPLEKFILSVRPQGGLAKDLGSVSVDFQMVGMDMGINQYPLTRLASNEYQQTIILPVCTTTRTDWVATLNFTTTSGVFIAKIPFVVDRR